MSNIRVKAAIERIQNELNKVGKHITQYSGIDPKDAKAIELAAEDIQTTAGQIRWLAEQTQK